MKKLLLVLLALLMLVTMAGCDKGKVSDNWKDMEFKLAGENTVSRSFLKTLVTRAGSWMSMKN